MPAKKKVAKKMTSKQMKKTKGGAAPTAAVSDFRTPKKRIAAD